MTNAVAYLFMALMAYLLGPIDHLTFLAAAGIVFLWELMKAGWKKAARA